MGTAKGIEPVSFSGLTRKTSDAAEARSAVSPRSFAGGLRIGETNDVYEQEADRVANEIAAGGTLRRHWSITTIGATSLLHRKCSCEGSGSSSDCDECKKTEEQTVQREAVGPPASSFAPPIVHEVLHSPGEPLSQRTRVLMETPFGHDLTRVRIHTDSKAAESARAINALAYTAGDHIAFAAGQYAPEDKGGSRLLAHELTHVIQQNRAGRRLLQRDEQKGVAKDKDKDKDKDASQPPAPAQPEPGTAYFHIVVRDSGLDLGGGVLVSDLADAKTKLIKRKIDKPWTLVLAIHASQNRLGAQSPPDWQKNAIFYDEAAIKTLFGGDSAFVAWRDKFGPNRVVLYGCQVTAAFEQTIADNLARGGKAPTASGLGEGCKPRATTVTFGVDTRRAYDSLSDPDKQKVLGDVQAANNTWGYYGGPPVPNDQVLDHLFKGPKPGSWPQVEVLVKQGDDYVSANPPIPYWNRLSNSTFLRQCTKAVGNLREHKPQAPTMREGE
jgi:hypothetical protein